MKLLLGQVIMDVVNADLGASGIAIDIVSISVPFIALGNYIHTDCGPPHPVRVESLGARRLLYVSKWMPGYMR
jgi:hypothetical protein